MGANVRHSSASVEHYTPVDIVEAAREALGGVIDLDPASNAFANEVVRAKRYFDAEANGLTAAWRGKVFLNPPGRRCDYSGNRVVERCGETGACGKKAPHVHGTAQSAQKTWWFKLAKSYLTERVTAAVFVSFSIELLQTSQIGSGDLPLPLDFPICFPRKRIAYDQAVNGVRKPGKSPPHSSMLVFLPDRNDKSVSIARFTAAFARFGEIINAR